mmetsp:Transcript_23980/g.51763  ORF Transcript_23980/g.51763 Transcript_23980/m.51763 type:complete len:312 (+) Transcript_23980:175-1110(+)
MPSKFLLWWDVSSVALSLSTLPIAEVNRICLDIANTNHGWSQTSTRLHEDLGVLVVSGCLDNGPGTCLGVVRFENSTSNEYSIHTKLHHEGGISRGGNTSSSKVHHGQTTIISDPLNKIIRSLKHFGSYKEFILRHASQTLNLRLNSSGMTHGLNNVSSTSLTLGTKEGGTLGNTTKCLTKVTASTHEGNIEHGLINVVHLIGHGQNLRLINVVNFACLEDLGLDKMSDTGLGHDGDGDGVLDFENHGWVGHAGYSAIAADVCGDALEGHDCYGSGGFCDFGLFYVHDIHNHSSLEHLRQTLLDLKGADLD